MSCRRHGLFSLILFLSGLKLCAYTEVPVLLHLDISRQQDTTKFVFDRVEDHNS